VLSGTSVLELPVVLSSEFSSVLIPTCQRDPNFGRRAGLRRWAAMATAAPRLSIVPELPPNDILSLIVVHPEVIGQVRCEFLAGTHSEAGAEPTMRLVHLGPHERGGT
jgi:hypothetical protein